MVSKFSLLSSLLLASATLAVPSSLAEAPIAHGREDRQPRHIDLVASRADALSDVVREQKYSTNWAGAVIKSCEPTFTYVTGIITVPGGGDRNPPAVWLGVDHDSCPDNALSLGFKLKTLSPSGVPTFAAFYSWGRKHEFLDDCFPVITGDEIVATINILTRTRALLHLYKPRDPSNPRNPSRSIVAGDALCQRDVEWGVEGDLEAFLKFNSATIIDAYAKVFYHDQRFYVSRANIVFNVGLTSRHSNLTYTDVTIDKQVISIWRPASLEHDLL